MLELEARRTAFLPGDGASFHNVMISSDIEKTARGSRSSTRVGVGLTAANSRLSRCRGAGASSNRRERTVPRDDSKDARAAHGSGGPRWCRKTGWASPPQPGRSALVRRFEP